MKKVYGYARVSTKEQHLDRQIKAHMEYGIDECDIITDKATGADLDRLSRSKSDIKNELEYAVMFFYVSMAIFFTCLLGRENNDIVYSMNLPIRKSGIVKARILFAVVIQLLQLVIMIPLTMLSQRVNPAGNQAGMDANIALFGIGFIVYGLFNLVFFSSYYKNVDKVGISFIKSSVLIFICAALDVISTYAIPFVRDVLDTSDPNFLASKLAFLGVGVLIYIVLTVLTCKACIRRFDNQDLH